MNELTNWLLVFLRVSAMLAVFPVFSAPNFPAQLRLALGALLAGFICPALPVGPVPAADLWGLTGLMAAEVCAGLLFGFVSRLLFYALEMAGVIITADIGLTLPPGMSPMNDAQVTAPSSLLYYLAAMLWLGLDLHHWLLVGVMRTYHWLPIGAAHFSEACLMDLVARSSETFVIALQLAAPVMAVSFIVSLVFSVLGRAVPQMNVFHESFAIRTLAGLSVFGITLDLMAEHIANYLRRLPEDVLTVAQLVGTR